MKTPNTAFFLALLTTSMPVNAADPAAAETKPELVLSVTETRWTRESPQAKYEITREGSALKPVYRYTAWSHGKQTERRDLSPSEYDYFRGRMHAMILAEEGKRGPASANCQAAWEITLPHLDEKGKVCAGDLKASFEVRAFFNSFRAPEWAAKLK